MAVEKTMPARRRIRHELPCVLMRAGTSKGLFIHRKDLPKNQEDWARCLVSVMGSRGNDARQVDGVGGGSSTTSKVAVISPSQRPGVDVDFTFVQVSVGKEKVDFTGTCGNITSGVGAFAIQEGLVRTEPGQTSADVVIYNTNTDRVVINTVELDESGDYQEDGDYSIAGVKTTGSEVKCTFVDPKGSMTGALFPSEQLQQTLEVNSADVGSFEVRVTLIDSANPFVLIDATSISNLLKSVSPKVKDAVVESIRQHGAVEMGLARTCEEAAQTRGTPKAALVSPPTPEITARDGVISDILVQAYSMGLPHPSLQLTGAVTIAVALQTPGTVAADVSEKKLSEGDAPPTPARTPSPTAKKSPNVKDVRIAHSQGTISVSVALNEKGEVRSCAVSRTARRLFEGKARYYIDE